MCIEEYIRHTYKQARSLQAGLSVRSAVEMCVIMDSAIGSVQPRFRGLLVRESQIVFVDGKIPQSTLYVGRGQPLLHRLQSQGVSG